MGDIIEFKNVCRRKGGKYMIDIEKSRKIEIENIVKDILSDSDFSQSPSIDIVSLVKSNDFAVQTSEMDMDTTGCLIVNDIKPVMDTNKNRLIVVNKNFNNNNNDDNYILKKSRFITAHEFGHYILHKKDGQPIYAHRDTHHRTERTELEADYFARSILMPYNIFNQYVETMEYLGLFNNRETAIELLSTIFKTTKDKISKRLGDLEELKGCV